MTLEIHYLKLVLSVICLWRMICILYYVLYLDIFFQFTVYSLWLHKLLLYVIYVIEFKNPI